jgi:hypothetical protein
VGSVCVSKFRFLKAYGEEALTEPQLGEAIAAEQHGGRVHGSASNTDLDELNLALLAEGDDWENVERAPEPPEEHAPQQAGVILVSSHRLSLIATLTVAQPGNTQHLRRYPPICDHRSFFSRLCASRYPATLAPRWQVLAFRECAAGKTVREYRCRI